MNNTLNDLQQLHTSKNSKEEQSIIDREAYIRGRKGYPTALPQSLPEGTTERYMGCYMMGYNAAEWEIKRGYSKNFK